MIGEAKRFTHHFIDKYTEIGCRLKFYVISNKTTLTLGFLFMFVLPCRKTWFSTCLSQR